MWFCPTFQRPARLRALAESWEVCEPGKGLLVRVWSHDPFKDEYFAMRWPKTWVLYESEEETCVDAVNEFFHSHQGQQNFGFIGDDVVLRTYRGLEKLEEAAGSKYIAYPNDLIQRNRLCTHFCMGGDIARTLEHIFPPRFKHGYCDVALFNLGINTGILRYQSNVIFDHQHPVVKKAEWDETYELGESYLQAGERDWKEYSADQLGKDVIKILTLTHQETENPGNWRYQDATVRSAIA
jgi:hypothetical protein